MKIINYQKENKIFDELCNEFNKKKNTKLYKELKLRQERKRKEEQEKRELKYNKKHLMLRSQYGSSNMFKQLYSKSNSVKDEIIRHRNNTYNNTNKINSVTNIFKLKRLQTFYLDQYAQQKKLLHCNTFQQINPMMNSSSSRHWSFDSSCDVKQFK